MGDILEKLKLSNEVNQILTYSLFDMIKVLRSAHKPVIRKHEKCFYSPLTMANICSRINDIVSVILISGSYRLPSIISVVRSSLNAEMNYSTKTDKRITDIKLINSDNFDTLEEFMKYTLDPFIVVIMHIKTKGLKNLTYKKEDSKCCFTW